MKDLRAYNKLSDDAVIADYRRTGDNRLLGLVLQRYTGLLLGVAFKYLKNQTAAEDAVQQILLHALTHFPNEPIINLKGWLYVLMRNYCLTQLRNHQYFVPADTLQDQLTEAHVDTQILWHKEYEVEQLHTLLSTLPEQQQQVLKMFYLQNESYDSICQKTGFTFMQVKSYIQNGKRNLRLKLQATRLKDE